MTDLASLLLVALWWLVAIPCITFIGMLSRTPPASPALPAGAVLVRARNTPAVVVAAPAWARRA